MNFARLPARLKAPDEERRAQILAAAARAFVRYGFHAATMSEIAEEAGMSAGNLYRYFPSKEAMVEGLCESDQAERSDSFAALLGAVDLIAAMRATLREHVLNCAPEKARLIVEIWAESSRNTRVAEITRQLDREVMEGMVELFDLAKRQGEASEKLDARFAARAMISLIVGLFRRVALDPHFDVAAETAMALGLFDALIAGALGPSAEV